VKPFARAAEGEEGDGIEVTADCKAQSSKGRAGKGKEIERTFLENVNRKSHELGELALVPLREFALALSLRHAGLARLLLDRFIIVCRK
jgi:hypothetical protein